MVGCYHIMVNGMNDYIITCIPPFRYGLRKDERVVGILVIFASWLR
jgi:hypothetical protein